MIIDEDEVDLGPVDYDVHPLLRRQNVFAEGNLSDSRIREAKPPQLSLFPGSGPVRREDVRDETEDEDKIQRRREAVERLREERFWRHGRETVRVRIKEMFAEIDARSAAGDAGKEMVEKKEEVGEAEGERNRKANQGSEPKVGMLRRTLTTMSRLARGR